MIRLAALSCLFLAACSSSEQTTRSGCLFWSTDCTQLEAAPSIEPLEFDQRRPAVAPLDIPERAEGELPKEDLGRVRAAHRRSDTLPDQTERLTEMFSGDPRGPTANTVYPLPANCSRPPSSLMRNTAGGRLAPGRNSAAASAYAGAYRRCGSPGTWPRP